MTEPEETQGMGTHSSGPSFVPWFVSAPPADPGTEAARYTVDQSSAAFRPPRNRWPAVMTVLVVLIVGVVVAVSTVVALREDRRPVASRIVSPRSPAPVPANRMEFVTGTADGVLIVADRVWASTGVRRPVSGSYLHVEVELICRSGRFAYGPGNFSAFDAGGELFEVTDAGRWGTPLGYGILSEGESVRGTIAFDLPRGEVTLLMSDDSSQAVTALKIPD